MRNDNDDKKCDDVDCMLILSKVRFGLNHIFLLVAILKKIQRELLQLLRYKNSKLHMNNLLKVY